MVLAYIQDIASAEKMLQSASQLALALKKDFGVLSFCSENDSLAEIEKLLVQGLQHYDIKPSVVIVKKEKMNAITDVCEQSEGSFLFLQLPTEDKKTISQYLKASRELRIPYICWKTTYDLLDMTKVLIPITFLEEELEKGQFASAFGRFCNSEILLLEANDYGTKAKKNIQRMLRLFENFDFPYEVVKAEKDSFGVDKESLTKAKQIHAGVILVSASREYGLDDIFFGPKELHVVRKSEIPIMLINPRADLYALCD